MASIAGLKRRLVRLLPDGSKLGSESMMRSSIDEETIIKKFLKLKLEPKRKLKLLERVKMVEPLNLPGADLKFSVSSMTEYGRVSRVKETWTGQWVQSLPKGTVLWDVGANIGVFSLLAAKLDNVQYVVAIEPSSRNVAALYRNASLNGLCEKVVVVAGGLGEETGMRVLNLQNEKPGGALHSFGEVIYAGGDKKPESVGKELSFLYRLDDLVALDGMPFPTHIKIDVDGFELSVLRGAAQTLADRRLVALQVEVMGSSGETALKDAVNDLLSGFGFELYETIHHGTNSIATDLRFRRPAA